MPRQKYEMPSEDQILELHASYMAGIRLVDAGKPFLLSQDRLSSIFKNRGLAVRDRGKCRVKPTIAQSVEDSALVDFKAQWDRLDSTVKGTVAENYTKNRLAELGFDVWEPVAQNHRTDLIVVCGNEALRIQVKSATYDPAHRRFRANTTRRRRGSGIRRHHEEEDVDFFVIYCGGLAQLEFYVIPASVVGSRPCLNFVPNRRKYANFPGKTCWESYRNAFHLLAQQ